jgi:hypothetical protein
MGQERKLGFADHQKQSGGSSLKASAKSVLQQLPGVSLAYVAPDNQQYYKQKFADGSEMYCFRRYGTWQDADIDGLHNLINPDQIARLLKQGGTSVVYSHLGKRHPSGKDRQNHIPDATRDDLRNLKAKFDSKELMLSPVSDLLDYLVLRDNISIIGSEVNFRPDGIRYEKLNESDLRSKTFSLARKSVSAEKMIVKIDGVEVKPVLRNESDSILSIVF